MQQLQEGDESLAAVRKEVEGGIRQTGRGFYKREGLMYRRWTTPGRDEEELVVEQLVLPQKCRGVVLELAHSILLAGHMGKKCRGSFYWPTLYKDMADYSRTSARRNLTADGETSPPPPPQRTDSKCSAEHRLTVNADEARY